MHSFSFLRLRHRRSFHVGSGCNNAAAYLLAVTSARNVFDLAATLGFQFDLLDIGGGFPGLKNSTVSFSEVRVCMFCLYLKKYSPCTEFDLSHDPVILLVTTCEARRVRGDHIIISF